ncbi:hypothetical protein D6789_00795, partial [Candidatus Woesearchaeota archaeon]
DPSIFVGEGGDAVCEENPALNAAAQGDNLRLINGEYSAANEGCSVNTGIAFDGTNLLVPCWYTNVIDVLSPADGSLQGTVTVPGYNGLNANAWDATRNKLWQCADGNKVILVDMSDGSSEFKFTAEGACHDGLAYDGTDDTLWVSGDVSNTLYHYKTDGTLIETLDLTGKIGGCANSGIAVGGDKLYLANNGCSQIYQADKDLGSSTLFATFPARLEDMECDDITFADQGVGAIWSIDAYDRQINAWEIPKGQCGFGGLPAVHECDDGIDNDGDNLTDYPDDPDCDSPTDDTEAEECIGTGIDWFVTQDTPIKVTCEDPSPHPVAHEQLCFKVSYEGDSRSEPVSEDECLELGGEMTDEGCYLTENYCQEELFRAEINGNPFDSSAYFDEETGNCCIAPYVEVDGLSAEDAASKVRPIFQEPVSYYFNFQEDSIHNFEFVCEDILGNENEADLEYFAVDSVPPESEKHFTGPQFFERVCEDGGEKILSADTIGAEGVNPADCWTVEYIDTASRVVVDAEDPLPHPSGLDKTWYKIDVYDDDFSYCERPDLFCNADELGAQHPYDQELCDSQAECRSLGACIDDVQEYCTDNWEADQYDSWETCVEQESYDSCGLSEDWKLYRGEPLAMPEESCHVMQYFSVDNLGNYEDLQFNCFFVDKQPPAEDTLFESCTYEDHDACYIGSLTDIGSDAWDVEPHPSGLDTIAYRVTRVADAACRNETLCEELVGDGEWTAYNDTVFNITEESCHLIEVNVSDKVEKDEVYKRCVFVDTSAPAPNKTVGEPSEPMSEEHQVQGEVFYENLSTTCDEEGKCWDVTLLTPISLDCSDPEPHPSGVEQVCFQVGLDGDDVTEQYCDDKEGDMNDNGYCCIAEGTDFLFNEESWHELSYYCVDNTCNEGDVDTEYFKVEGTPFHIYLYKKWNLISVPFVLINDDPAVVFGDLENVESVWTYDSVAGEWLVWRPEGPSDLEHITPGWGYWVMMKDDETLTIGGSLFQPAKLPPSKPLMPGWNLIGTYGTQWQNYPEQEDISFMCGDEYGPKEETFGSEVYCALNSLVDTQQGFPRWSSLWSYVNCGNHVAGWTGLNACPFDEGSLGPSELYKTSADRMYAGRGYWVEMDVEDEYSPATNCVWNLWNLCVGSEGFLPL